MHATCTQLYAHVARARGRMRTQRMVFYFLVAHPRHEYVIDKKTKRNVRMFEYECKSH